MKSSSVSRQSSSSSSPGSPSVFASSLPRCRLTIAKFNQALDGIAREKTAIKEQVRVEEKRERSKERVSIVKVLHWYTSSGLAFLCGPGRSIFLLFFPPSSYSSHSVGVTATNAVNEYFSTLLGRIRAKRFRRVYSCTLIVSGSEEANEKRQKIRSEKEKTTRIVTTILLLAYHIGSMKRQKIL